MFVASRLLPAASRCYLSSFKRRVCSSKYSIAKRRPLNSRGLQVQAATGNKYYAVAVGRKPGIYLTWKECEAQVSGYPGAKHKSFKTRHEAEMFIRQESNQSDFSFTEHKRIQRQFPKKPPKSLSDEYSYGRSQESAGKYYAVARGRVPGIYRTWSDCQKQTDYFSGAIFKSFTSRDQAEQFMEENLDYDKENENERYNQSEEFARLNEELSDDKVTSNSTENVTEASIQTKTISLDSESSRQEQIRSSSQTPTTIANVINVYFDGVMKKSPAAIGCGAILEDNESKQIIMEGCRYIPKEATVNEAAFQSLILGLHMAQQLHANEITISGDSKYVVSGLNKTQQIKNENLQRFYGIASAMMDRFEIGHIGQIDGKENKPAEKNAKEALASQESRVSYLLTDEQLEELFGKGRQREAAEEKDIGENSLSQNLPELSEEMKQMEVQKENTYQIKSQEENDFGKGSQREAAERKNINKNILSQQSRELSEEMKQFDFANAQKEKAWEEVDQEDEGWGQQDLVQVEEEEEEQDDSQEISTKDFGQTEWETVEANWEEIDSDIQVVLRMLPSLNVLPKLRAYLSKSYEAVVIEFDGAALSNPGVGGCGACVRHKRSGQVLIQGYQYLGDYVTNNTAEFKGLILGLLMARHIGAQRVFIQGDSELLIKGIKGTYNIAKRHLSILMKKIKKLFKSFKFKPKVKFVYRERNSTADWLAGSAARKRQSKVELKVLKNQIASFLT